MSTEISTAMNVINPSSPCKAESVADQTKVKAEPPLLDGQGKRREKQRLKVRKRLQNDELQLPSVSPAGKTSENTQPVQRTFDALAKAHHLREVPDDDPIRSTACTGPGFFLSPDCALFSSHHGPKKTASKESVEALSSCVLTDGTDGVILGHLTKRYSGRVRTELLLTKGDTAFATLSYSKLASVTGKDFVEVMSDRAWAQLQEVFAHVVEKYQSYAPPSSLPTQEKRGGAVKRSRSPDADASPPSSKRRKRKGTGKETKDEAAKNKKKERELKKREKELDEREEQLESREEEVTKKESSVKALQDGVKGKAKEEGKEPIAQSSVSASASAPLVAPQVARNSLSPPPPPMHQHPPPTPCCATATATSQPSHQVVVPPSETQAHPGHHCPTSVPNIYILPAGSMPPTSYGYTAPPPPPPAPYLGYPGAVYRYY